MNPASASKSMANLIYINCGLYLILMCSKFMDRVISVEYAARDDDDDRRNGYSPERRGRDMSPDRRSHDRGRSPSPYHRDRASPDYGHGANANSRSEPRGSPNYDRDESPVNERYHRLILCPNTAHLGFLVLLLFIFFLMFWPFIYHKYIKILLTSLFFFSIFWCSRSPPPRERSRSWEDTEGGLQGDWLVGHFCP